MCMSQSFASLLGYYLPAWRPRGRWNIPCEKWWEVYQILGTESRWIPPITSSCDIQKPDCLSFVDTTYRHDEVLIWKHDVILHSGNRIYGHIEIDKIGNTKYIKTVTMVRWEVGTQWMIDFLSRAEEKFWITHECKSYQKILEYFTQRLGL